jgi:hypothetical protein
MGGSALLHTVTFAAVLVMVLLTVWIVLLLESGGHPPLESGGHPPLESGGHPPRDEQGLTKLADHPDQETRQ